MVGEISNATTRIALIGGGHAHLHAVKHAARFHARNLDLALIDPGKFWYSGMATGMLGGQYDVDRDTIDLAGLCERNGVTFLQDRMIAADEVRKKIMLAKGEAVSYDVLSFNVGSEIAVENLPGAIEYGWPVKPIHNLWRLRQALEAHFQREQKRARIVVIGGGATGCEIAANLAELARRRKGAVNVTLVSRSSGLLPNAPAGAQRRIHALLASRNIDIVCPRSVNRIDKSAVYLEDGDALDCDFAVVATGLRAPAWLDDLPFAMDEHGLRVESTLQVENAPGVFAVGDCMSFIERPLPKLGVFGVRAAPVLLKNLISTASDEPLMQYQPQKRYLAILNLGQNRALALWDKFYWYGWSSHWLKTRLDTGFLRQYRP